MMGYREKICNLTWPHRLGRKSAWWNVEEEVSGGSSGYVKCGRSCILGESSYNHATLATLYFKAKMMRLLLTFVLLGCAAAAVFAGNSTQDSTGEPTDEKAKKTYQEGLNCLHKHMNRHGFGRVQEGR
jgi:hypothetical protein